MHVYVVVAVGREHVQWCFFLPPPPFPTYLPTSLSQLVNLAPAGRVKIRTNELANEDRREDGT